MSCEVERGFGIASYDNSKTLQFTYTFRTVLFGVMHATHSLFSSSGETSIAVTLISPWKAQEHQASQSRASTLIS